jgi:hypothetical protein
MRKRGTSKIEFQILFGWVSLQLLRILNPFLPINVEHPSYLAQFTQFTEIWIL